MCANLLRDGTHRCRFHPMVSPKNAPEQLHPTVAHRSRVFGGFVSGSLPAGTTLRAAYMSTVTTMMRAGGVTDDRSTLHKAYWARVTTGVRNPLLARLEMWEQAEKFRLFLLLRTVAMAMAQ